MAVARDSRLETRERLLTAAGELFVSDGYLETTVAQICTRAGLSNGSFFHLFKAKAQIADALIADIGRSYRENVLSRLLLPPRPPEQAIGAVLNAHMLWVAGDGTRARLWFGLRPALLYLGGDRTRGLPAGDVVEAVGEWAAPLVASGEIRQMSIELVAAHIFGAINAIGAMQTGDGAADAMAGGLARGMTAAAWSAIRGKARSPQRTKGQNAPILSL